MIGPGTGRPNFLATGVTDLRRGVAGLHAVILDQLGQERLSGALSGSRRADRPLTVES
jgi:transposase